MNKPALGTSQGPMLEAHPPRSDALNYHARLALRTARSLDLAGRQPIGKLSVWHGANLRLSCPGVDFKSGFHKLRGWNRSFPLRLQPQLDQAAPSAEPLAQR
jgi:hypothetical protein